MKKLFTLLALVCCVATGVWADLTENTVVNCDFSKGETLFTNPSRVTVQNSATNENLEFVAASNASNGNAGAKYNFGGLLSSGVKQLTISFDTYIGDQTSGLFAIGEASKRTYTGSGAWGATTTGSIFSIGINREKVSGSNANCLRINGVTLSAKNSYLTSWMHVDLSINLETKKQTYKVYKTGDDTDVIASATDVDFTDANVTSCDIIDFFTGTNSVTYYMDNLVIKEYYDASVTYYTATFTEGNSLTPAVTIYSNEARTAEVTNGSLENGTTYYYKAVLAGYNDYLGSFTVNAENPTVNFTMTEKTKYTVTVNAVDGSSNVIKTLKTIENCYDGLSVSYFYPKYITNDEGVVTYSCADFGKTTTTASSATINVAYSAYEGTAMYAEGEDKISATTIENDNCSMGKAVRGFTTEKNVLTIKETGAYKLTYAVCSNNVNYDTYVYVYRNDTEIASFNAKLSTNYIKTTGTQTLSDVILFEGDVIKFKGGSTNLILDYVLAEKTGDASISIPIGATGYATYYNSAQKYIVPEGMTTYSFGQNNETQKYGLQEEYTYGGDRNVVPEGVAQVLKGTPNTTYTLVFTTASAWTPGPNMLKGTDTEATTTGDFPETKFYALSLDSEGKNVGFYWMAEDGAAFTNGAHKAYLTIDPGMYEVIAGSAPKMGFPFNDDEATAITNAKVSESNNASVYNLAGQRVTSTGYKGILIKNGKKVINK